jgi:hypothetical protein
VSKPATQSGFVKLPTILTQLVVDVGAALAVLIATATPSVFKPAGDPSRLGDESRPLVDRITQILKSSKATWLSGTSSSASMWRVADSIAGGPHK